MSKSMLMHTWLPVLGQTNTEGLVSVGENVTMELQDSVAVRQLPSCMQVGVEERIGVRNTIARLSGVWDMLGESQERERGN